MGFFLTGVILALLMETAYRRLIRFLFAFFTGDRIQFFCKDFHLFPKVGFILSFGSLAAIMYISLKHLSFTQWLKQLIITVSIFLLTTALVTYTASKILIIECTACDDRIIKLNSKQVSYDQYFVTSTVLCIIYLLIIFLLHRRSLLTKSS